MHPADCIRVFATLAEEGKDEAAIAHRYGYDPREVRRMLTETKVTTGHRLFRFIGAAAYAEAGGGITRDLFAKDGEGYADDPALVQQLADAKLEVLASEAEIAGWGEVVASEQTRMRATRGTGSIPTRARVIPKRLLQAIIEHILLKEDCIATEVPLRSCCERWAKMLMLPWTLIP